MKKTRFPKTLTTVTPLSKMLALCIILAFIFAGVYVGMYYQRIVDSTWFSTYLSTASTHSSIQDGQLVRKITLQDNGKNISVHVGDILSFDIGNISQKWTLTFSSNVLKQVPTGSMGKPGQQGRYVVMQNGTDVVSGTGLANCSVGTMCPQYAMHFSVTITAEK